MSGILVVGGAGYIGSHMVLQLVESGHKVVVLDDLSTGHADAVLGATFVHGSLADPACLDQVFSTHSFDAVMHFAACINVGESVQDPAKYYQNNVANTLNLLRAMCRHRVLSLVFSSTAAVFGEPQYTPIDEHHPMVPVNPYGASKQMVEQILRDFDQAYGLRSVALRYFNAAGADPQARLGERHEPETHLIPLVLQVAAGLRKQIMVYGDDYATTDGTCVRDYIHVIDLCQAHALALDYLQQGGSTAQFNLGNGQGFSVKQVIQMAEEITQRDIAIEVTARRLGDPAVLVADAQAAKQQLGWQPQYADLAVIIEHAWQFILAQQSVAVAPN